MIGGQTTGDKGIPGRPPALAIKRCRDDANIRARMVLAIGKCYCFDVQPCAELPEGARDIGYMGCDSCFGNPDYPHPPLYSQTVFVAGICGPSHPERGGVFPFRRDCRCFQPCPPGELPKREMRVSDRSAYDTMLYFRVNGPTQCCQQI